MPDDICGSENTTSGEPCKFSPGDSCPYHDVEETPDNGRPSKLTYERQEGIATMLEEGRSMESAARTNGVDPATVYNWLDRGEAEYKQDNSNEYRDFYERVVRAKGHGEEWYFNTVVQIAKEEGDHRFLASLMKQRYPDSWGDTETGVDAEQTVIQIPDRVANEWQQSNAKQ